MTRKKKSFMVMAAVFVAFAILAAACSKKSDSAAEGKGGKGGAAGETAVFAVNTTEAIKGPISDYIELSGDLIAGSTVDVYSEAAKGKVSRVYVSVGSRVGRGARIALIDPSQPGMTYVEHIVYAPIAGTITDLPIKVGMTISQTTSLAKISGGGGLEVQLYVPERYISKISNGLACQISLDAYPGELFRGKIDEISPTVDVASRTEMIKVNVDNSSSRLKVGMFAKVKIITENKSDIVQIPAAAIVQREGKNVVFVATPDNTDSRYSIARQIEVTPGIIIDSAAEIQSGLESGDQIVTKGMSLLTDEARINIIQREASVGGTK
ncbi:MAG: efflux RND transporter periplasmic adaptor subunit [Spirochaetaceae bacterium]|jgi:multidrug efflux pump subunit AcrA (membrane-fusion protein)|nr:efflux RND transporter periplasmic adaptor subunit [Spirochaetaceae bacterium]